MMNCWKINPKDRFKFQQLSQMLLTIQNFHVQTSGMETETENQGEADLNRDSYLHPVEENTSIEDDATNNHLQGNKNIKQSHDSYLHPFEDGKNTVVMEMNEMNM